MIEDFDNSEYYKHVPEEDINIAVNDSYDHYGRDKSESPSRQPKGFIVRVFDGDLSQTKEEAYDKHCSRQRDSFHTRVNEKVRSIHSKTKTSMMNVLVNSRQRNQKTSMMDVNNSRISEEHEEVLLNLNHEKPFLKSRLNNHSSLTQDSIGN